MPKLNAFVLVSFIALVTAGSGCTDPADDAGQTVVINELTSSESDDIELFNATDTEVDISSWILTDDAFVMANYDAAVDDKKYVFPEGTIVPAGGYLTVVKGDESGQHPFGVKSEGETLTLIKSNGDLADQVTFQEDQAEISYCRVPDGSLTWQRCTATFGAANQ